MPIKQVVCCDKCGRMINDSIEKAQGFAFVGNVNVVDSKESECVGSGIIGNNLRDEDNRNMIESISYYCRLCTVEVLFGKHYELKQTDTLFRNTLMCERQKM